MGPTRAFFPQHALDQGIEDGSIEVTGDRVTIVASRRSYRVTEAVHVLAEVSSTPDPYDLSGKVKTIGYLTELEAEILDCSMVIGDNAYDVAPGWMGVPAEPMPDRASGPPQSDEDLLAQFLMRTL
jgi:hypothetical protein